jgi:hypothetical protein
MGAELSDFLPKPAVRIDVLLIEGVNINVALGLHARLILGLIHTVELPLVLVGNLHKVEGGSHRFLS